MGHSRLVPEIVGEFEELSLGDKRINARALQIVRRLSGRPSDSFPEQMSSDAELEALYRFFANPKVTMAGLLASHVHATHERCAGRSVVRVVHDTTAMKFEGEREGLGVLRGFTKGFYVHASLAVSADESREPLGVVAVKPFVHVDAVAHRGMTASARVAASRAKPRGERESSRWERQAIDVAKALPAGTRAIHLMDQEGDDFHVFAALQKEDQAFVIRVNPKRKTAGNEHARAALAEKPATLLRTVHVSARPDYLNRRKCHPVRAEREARLEVRWGNITLRRHDYVDLDVDELTLSAVHVFEPDPPAGEQPIEWMLMSSENVASVQDAAAIVDHYRARWLVEEYFKALKTG